MTILEKLIGKTNTNYGSNDNSLKPYDRYQKVKNPADPCSESPASSEQSCCTGACFTVVKADNHALSIRLSILTAATILLDVGFFITWTTYTDYAQLAGSNPYFVVFFTTCLTTFIYLALALILALEDRIAWVRGVITERQIVLLPLKRFKSVILIGVLFALHNLLTFYAGSLGGTSMIKSDSKIQNLTAYWFVGKRDNRTAPTLQAVFYALNIPFVVLFRFFLTKKQISTRRMVCAGMVFIGVLVSAGPYFLGFNYPFSDQVLRVVHTYMHPDRYIFPLIYIVGVFLIGLAFVYIEREVKHYKRKIAFKIDPAVLLFWTHLVTTATLGALFWVEFIPSLGTSSNFEEFSTQFLNGLRAQFGFDVQFSKILIPLALTFIFFYSISLYLQILVIQASDGAAYVTISVAVSTVLASLFWTLFKADPLFHYSLSIDLRSGFLLMGLVIVLPSLILYAIFSFNDEEETVDESNPLDLDLTPSVEYADNAKLPIYY